MSFYDDSLSSSQLISSPSHLIPKSVTISRSSFDLPGEWSTTFFSHHFMRPIPSSREIQAYFYQHDIEGLMGGVVELLALNLPNDPVKFLSDYFLDQVEGSDSDVEVGSGSESPIVQDYSFPGNREYSFPKREVKKFEKPERKERKERPKKSKSRKDSQEPRHPFSYIHEQDDDGNVQVEHDPNYVDNVRTIADIDSHEAEAIRRRYSVSHDRRSGFSAEIIGVEELQQQLPMYPKTDDQKARLAAATDGNIMMNSIDRDGRDLLYSAMFECNFEAGKVIMQQGDEGDNFYVVESGVCEVIKKEKGEEKIVQVVKEGGCFGELALIHGTPRAATVKAKTNVKCWAIGRLTYRKIMMNATLQKRKMYEEFLKKVTILEQLTSYERMTVADALVQCEYDDGEVIVKQGDQGHSFYIVVSGEVVVSKKIQGKEQEVARLSSGNYFGELALLLDEPRAATVRAVGNVHLVRMNRRSFNVLLGPCISIMKRDLKKYNTYVGKII